MEILDLDWSRCVLPPFDHQKIGVSALVKYPKFGLLDEMGMGKTKQIIDSACFLYEAETIDAEVIICPAQVKDVWVHPQFSQIIEHSWVPGIIHEFTSKSKKLPDRSNGLTWIVTSVELLRNFDHAKRLVALLKGRKYRVTCDESSTISNWRASQTKGAMYVAKYAARKVILNGTPVGNSPLNLYSQFEFLDPMILGFRNFYAFRNRHVQMGGYMNKQVVGFHNLEEVQSKIKPFVLRRLKKNCLDLPPKIPMPLREVRLSPKTWQIYSQMKEEFVAYLNDQDPDNVSTVTTAPVKALRLAQICSGFLGGIASDDESDEPITAEVGCELTNSFIENLELRLSVDPKFKLIVWCRFRPEIARLNRMLLERFPGMTVRVLQGGMKKGDRKEATDLFHPNSPEPSGAAVLIGQPQSGRFGLNFTKCSNVDYLSNDYSMLTRSQSEDRVDRPGQKFTVSVQDYIVVGPNRERTVSGVILKALKTHQDIANWTCSRWVAELTQENDDDVPF